MATGGADGGGPRKRARVNPDYLMIIRIGPDGERTQQPHYLTERCDCMPGVRVPDGVGYECKGLRRAQNWRYLQGYCSKGGRFRDGCQPASASGSVAWGCGALQRSEGKLRTDVVRPCKYHTDMIAYARNYIDNSKTSVQNRKTLKDEVAVLNEAIKDGIGEHLDRSSYQQIAHRAEWDDDDDLQETDHDRKVRELEDQLFDAKYELSEMRRGPTTREVGTQTDDL
eukprot:COSAG02_NODE_401_length_23083_cov_26.955839_5_plen_226_part_00